MYLACPFGERRRDIWAAFHTANSLCQNMKEKPTDDEFIVLVNELSRYLTCDRERTPEDEEETADMDALALMIKQQGGC